MLRFVKSIVGFGGGTEDKKKKKNGYSSGDEYLDSITFSDDSDSDEDLQSGGHEKLIKFKDDFDVKDLLGDKKGKDSYNDEWEAFEEDVFNNDCKKHYEIDPKNRSTKGVVSKVVSDNEIVIDGEKRIPYDKCNITDLSVGDVVNVETTEDNEVVIKPYRYKIFTGKITAFENHYKRYIFSGHAFMRKTSSTDHLKVGDIIRCVVVEVQTSQRYSWRAYPYTPICDPTSNIDDKIVNFTNELLENKNGIEILKEIDFGNTKLDSSKTTFVWIRNKTPKVKTLLSVDNEEGENQISFKNFHQHYGSRVDPPYVIGPNKEAYVELICESKYCGEHKELIAFTFEGFKIGRFASVTVLDFCTDDEMPKGKRWDSKDYRRRQYGVDTLIIPGEKLWNQNKHIFDKLERYFVPKELWHSLENNWPINECFPELSEQLAKTNYRSRFHAMLYLEECETQRNLSRYDMADVPLKKTGRFFAITVPGLAEGRPSLIIGDRLVIIGNMKSTEGKVLGYEGFVSEIKRDEVLVRFSDEFHKYFPGGLFKVMFQIHRVVFRRCHHAIDLAPHMVEQVLFPTNVLIKKPLKKIPFEAINWFNTSLNVRQKLAVMGALRGDSRPTPYIIFGPPGTGKTVTIVESILQVFDKIGDSRIIACTAANSSADLIAQKLLESGRVTPKDLIRVTAVHRANSVPEDVKSVTAVADEDHRKWLFHRIIVTTSSNAGVVFRHKIHPSHITHAFIDEAAQVTEPESLIPISMSVIGHGVVVLAGDHHQLGPVVQSTHAKSARLERSLMERLMTCFKAYERNDKFERYGYYNPKFVVKLVDNYRSDQQIMSIPSELFYENELKFNVERDHKLLKALNLETPLNFIGVNGDDRQDPDCPSWYNPQEIIQCCSILDRLYQSGVDPKDIGIITPYRKQVTRIRTHIHDMGLVECKVATIEEFQGLEKRVIILSMVRSAQKNLEHDIKYNLGFIHNSKRFNVAISRAMSLLYVIGNPSLLSRDRCWAALIDYCFDEKCYSGCQYRDYVPKSTLRRRMQNLSING